MAARFLANPGFVRAGLSLSAVVVVLDQLSKWYILGPLNFSPEGCREFRRGCGHIDVLPVLDLTMVWNMGVSFGQFQSGSALMKWVLVAFAVTITGVMSYWLTQLERRLAAVAVGLVIGGAVGNLIDRVRFGAVVDFIDFSDLWFPWVFNVADAAISVGVGVLFLDIVLEGREQRRA